MREHAREAKLRAPGVIGGVPATHALPARSKQCESDSGSARKPTSCADACATQSRGVAGSWAKDGGARLRRRGVVRPAKKPRATEVFGKVF